MEAVAFFLIESWPGALRCDELLCLIVREYIFIQEYNCSEGDKHKPNEQSWNNIGIVDTIEAYHNPELTAENEDNEYQVGTDQS